MDIIGKDAEITRLQKFEKAESIQENTIDLNALKTEIKNIEETQNKIIATEESLPVKSSGNVSEKVDGTSPVPVAPPRRKRKTKKDVKQVCRYCFDRYITLFEIFFSL